MVLREEMFKCVCDKQNLWMKMIIEINDIYNIGKEDVKITHLFNRTKDKTKIVVMHPVNKVDLDNTPPPRKKLHQNRYGIGIRIKDNKKLFIKLLSLAFYENSKKWHDKLKPLAKNLFLSSNFDDEKHIILQPMMKGSILNCKLQPNRVAKNVKKIKDFLEQIKKCKDQSLINYFNRIDMHRENIMIDHSEKNVYLVDFNPWPRCNNPEDWGQVIREIS